MQMGVCARHQRGQDEPTSIQGERGLAYPSFAGFLPLASSEYINPLMCSLVTEISIARCPRYDTQEEATSCTRRSQRPSRTSSHRSLQPHRHHVICLTSFPPRSEIAFMPFPSSPRTLPQMTTRACSISETLSITGPGTSSPSASRLLSYRHASKSTPRHHFFHQE
jgi:hypothetical protein